MPEQSTHGEGTVHLASRISVNSLLFSAPAILAQMDVVAQPATKPAHVLKLATYVILESVSVLLSVQLVVVCSYAQCGCIPD